MSRPAPRSEAGARKWLLATAGAALAISVGTWPHLQTDTASGQSAWEPIGPVTNSPISSIVVLFSGNFAIFAAAGVNGLFRSLNSGGAWESVLASPQAQRVNVVARTAGAGSLYAGSEAGVLRSGDFGGSWQSSPAFGDVTDIALPPLFDLGGAGFAVGLGDIWRSTDGARSWQNVTGGASPILSGAADNVAIWTKPSDVDTVFVGTARGVWWSEDEGDTWVWLLGPPNTDIRDIALSPNIETDGTMFTANPGGAVFRSIDWGVTWTESQLGTTADTTLVKISPAFGSDGTVVAGTSQGVFVSTDRGDTWDDVSEGLNSDIDIRAFQFSKDYATDETGFLGTAGGGLYKRVDILPFVPPTPTPTSSATPTATPTATATASPTPAATRRPTRTPSPTPTHTPIPVFTPPPPNIYAGSIIAEGEVDPGATLVARIGDYESAPVPVTRSAYVNLVVGPDDYKLVGEPIQFFLNDVRSDTTHVFKGGLQYEGFDLVFGGGSPVVRPFRGGPAIATPERTITLIALNTAVVRPRPTQTPTAVPAPSPTPALQVGLGVSITSVPADLRRPPQDAATPAPAPEDLPAATAQELIEALESVEEPEAEGAGGVCSRSSRGVTAATSLANLIYLFAPAVALGGYSRFVRRIVPHRCVERRAEYSCRSDCKC